MPRATGKTTLWFDDYPGENDIPKAQKTRIEIEFLDDEDLSLIDEKAVTTRDVFDPVLMQPVRERVISSRKDRQETAVRMVKNWENFVDGTGKKMECNKKNKRIWACNNEFMIYIKEKQLIVAKEATKRMEEARKNS